MHPLHLLLLLLPATCYFADVLDLSSVSSFLMIRSLTEQFQQEDDVGHFQSDLQSVSLVIVCHQWIEYNRLELEFASVPFRALIYQKFDNSLPNFVENRRGRETLGYLQYLVDSYDSLPEWSVFLHPHLSGSWHQPYSMIELLLTLDWEAMPQFTALPASKCFWLAKSRHTDEFESLDQVVQAWNDTEDQEKLAQAALFHVWGSLFERELGPAPQELVATCCLQSIVHRQRILARPKSFWLELLSSMSNQKLPDFVSSRLIEWTWHMLMGESQESVCVTSPCQLIRCDASGSVILGNK